MVFMWHYCDRLGTSYYTWVNICLFLYFIIHTQYVIFKQNRPQHPDVYVHYLKSWQHTDWMEHWVYCTAEARHHGPHRSTPATQLPWRRLTLMDSERGCGRTVRVYVQCVLSFIHLTWSSPHPQTTEQKSWWAACLEALLRVIFHIL